MNETRSSTALSTITRLARARTELVRDIDRAASGHGVGFSDLMLLRVLSEQPDGRMRRSDVAARLGVTPSAIARQLGPLERIGLVARESNPKDARLAIVVLTEAGERTAREAGAAAEDRATWVLDRFWTAEEQATLESLLAKVMPG